MTESNNFVFNKMVVKFSTICSNNPISFIVRNFINLHNIK